MRLCLNLYFFNIILFNNEGKKNRYDGKLNLKSRTKMISFFPLRKKNLLRLLSCEKQLYEFNEEHDQW
jgi:hypothetical protein